MLICTQCNKRFNECCCSDADKRLKEIIFDQDSNVITKWCRKCDKYYARCRCRQPDLFWIIGGIEITNENNPTIFKELKDWEAKKKGG